MRLPTLKHLAEAVRVLAESRNVCVLGSSALLVSFPDMGQPGDPLETSFDADLLITPSDEPLAAMLHEALGEGSLFAARTGYHVDILRPEIRETLPPGWEARVVTLQGAVGVVALSPEDLVVAKLRVGREKDLKTCRWLFTHQKLSWQAAKHRLDQTPMPESEVVTVCRRLDSCR